MPRFLFLVVAVLAMPLIGCRQGFTQQQMSSLTAGQELNAALARDHKITYVEAAHRDASEIRRMSNSRLTNNDELLLAFRLALAAEVDAGRMTPELADLRFKERQMANNEADQARQVAASAALLSAGAAMIAPAPRSMNCTSARMGAFVNTTCN